MASTTPGATVQYTVTVDQHRADAVHRGDVHRSLAGVLDDAAYNDNAAATAGTVSFASPDLTWTGNLAAGATATITFSVTVQNPDTGDTSWPPPSHLRHAGSNCPAGSTDPRCTATVRGAA